MSEGIDGSLADADLWDIERSLVRIEELRPRWEELDPSDRGDYRMEWRIRLLGSLHSLGQHRDELSTEHLTKLEVLKSRIQEHLPWLQEELATHPVQMVWVDADSREG